MPNDDLISRKALLENFDLENASYSTLMLYEVADMIMDAPTVDAKPVRHGKWSENISKEFVFCSACDDSSCGRGCFAFPNRPEITIWEYCPYCGAKMDLKEDG